MSASKELDKSWDGAPVDSYGKIGIRVVVLKKRKDGEARDHSALVDPEDGEPLDLGATPLDSYLEKPEHGKWCMVFLVAGQRHLGMDNAFLSRELKFKYLRNRTMVIIDLDGLVPEAIAKIVTGSRQGLYEGKELQAILDRVAATLKKDPDLVRLQQEAEQEIAELESGDEAVLKKLDQLIDSHHSAALHHNVGAAEPGATSVQQALAFGQDKSQAVVLKANPDEGKAATEPLLISDSSPSLRIAPGVDRKITVRSQPASAWAMVELIEPRIDAALEGLRIGIKAGENSGEVTLAFDPPPGLDPEEYPLEARIAVYAKFKGHAEPRLLQREIRIAPRSTRPPPPPVELKPVPTFIKIATRQPVRIVEGSASTHVRVRWDGLDELANGPGAPWTFLGKCLSVGTFPPITFSAPNKGLFDMLLDPPRGLIPGAKLDFEVEARGPGGAILKTAFKAEIVAAPPKQEPRKLTMVAPEPSAQRRPPYELKVVHENENWTGNCWDEEDFTAADVACFKEPTESNPLTLLLNDDAQVLKDFRAKMIAKKLDENTFKDRITKYNAHVSFHLYQMFRDMKQRTESGDEWKTENLRSEINRVGSTLLLMMEVSTK